ncbi:MAG: RagB/SusD family nutrient uptake outer membrane protein [Prevotella sp.]|jgi:hypothetical protein|nr:RagB/SusD family nutrient uptake outer membrane protein [Prevotella sp.]
MKKIFIIIIAIYSLSSCSGFFEQQPYGPPSSLTEMTEEEAMQAMYGLYHWQYVEGITGRGVMWYENCSDDFVTGRTNAGGDNIKNFYDIGRSGRDVDETWRFMYQNVRFANDILRELPAATQLTESVRTKLLGHALFFRAFSYLWLAPWYGDNGPNGGLPVITEDIDMEDMDIPRPASVLETYDFVIEEMKKAAGVLPYFDEIPAADRGFVHKTAAWTMIARAALYASAYDAKYFDIVLEYTGKIIETKKHDLVPEYADVFTEKENWSKEYIMSIVSNAIDGSKLPGMSFQNGGFNLYNTWGYFQPTSELRKAFEANDKRLKKTIVMPGDEIQFIGETIVWGFGSHANISSPTGMTFGKYLDPFREKDCVGKSVNPNGNNPTTTLNVPIARYADVLLMRAEALIWKNGEGDEEAVGLINKIRIRAGLPDDSKATKAQLKNERRCEFALEFGVYRHLDLVRWGDAKSIYNRPLHGYTITGTATNPRLTEKQVWRPRTNYNPDIHRVFAIPAQEILKSSNLKQNIGY